MNKTAFKNNKPIVLIGMMGAGKTTVGELLAKRLQLSWIDTDHHIEKVSGQTIPEIFQNHGENHFRQLESEALTHSLAHFDVTSSGGGVITIPKNIDLLKNAYVIYLKANIETLVARLSATDRPLLKDVDIHSKLTSLLEQRATLYEKNSVLTVETDQLTPSQVADEIEKNLEK